MPTRRTSRVVSNQINAGPTAQAPVGFAAHPALNFFDTLSWDGEPTAPVQTIISPTVETPITPAETAVADIFPIYAVVVTDGAIPEGSNLLHVSLQFTPELRWSRNILPQQTFRGIRANPRLTPAVLAEISVDAVPVEQAMREMTEWLARFEGDRVLVCSNVAFWHLLMHMYKYTGDQTIPFRSRSIDVESFCAGAAGSLKSVTKLKFTSPAKAMLERVATVEKAASEGGGFKLDW